MASVESASDSGRSAKSESKSSSSETKEKGFSEALGKAKESSNKTDTGKSSAKSDNKDRAHASANEKQSSSKSANAQGKSSSSSETTTNKSDTSSEPSNKTEAPAAKAAEVAAATTKGYTEALKDKKFGKFNTQTRTWTNGSTLDRYQTANSRVMSGMVGSQGAWMSAKNSGPVAGTQFEVYDRSARRHYDYTRPTSAVQTEVKVGTSFNGKQLAKDIRSGNRVHYDFLSSPLKDDFQTRQNSNIARVQRAAAQTQGRISVTQQSFGPSKAAVRTLQATSTAHVALKGVSRVAVPVGIGIDAYRISNAYKADGGRVGQQTGETLADVGGSWGGAVAGGAAGAKVGAIAGTAIGGPIGTAVGAAAGGLVGAVGGAIAGSSLGRAVFGWFSD